MDTGIKLGIVLGSFPVLTIIVAMLCIKYSMRKTNPNKLSVNNDMYIVEMYGFGRTKYESDCYRQYRFKIKKGHIKPMYDKDSIYCFMFILFGICLGIYWFIKAGNIQSFLPILLFESFLIVLPLINLLDWLVAKKYLVKEIRNG